MVLDPSGSVPFHKNITEIYVCVAKRPDLKGIVVETVATLPNGARHMYIHTTRLKRKLTLDKTIETKSALFSLSLFLLLFHFLFLPVGPAATITRHDISTRARSERLTLFCETKMDTEPSSRTRSRNASLRPCFCHSTRTPPLTLSLAHSLARNLLSSLSLSFSLSPPLPL